MKICTVEMTDHGMGGGGDIALTTGPLCANGSP